MPAPKFTPRSYFNVAQKHLGPAVRLYDKRNTRFLRIAIWQTVRCQIGGTMEQQILDALRPEFPDVHGSVVLEVETDRYNGRILAAKFKGLSFLERQRRVFNILRKTLGPDTQSISMLFTYTPDEYEQLKAA